MDQHVPGVVPGIQFRILKKLCSSTNILSNFRNGVIYPTSSVTTRALAMSSSYVKQLEGHVPASQGLTKHARLEMVKVKVAQSCLTHCDPMNYTVL